MGFVCLLFVDLFLCLFGVCVCVFGLFSIAVDVTRCFSYTVLVDVPEAILKHKFSSLSVPVVSLQGLGWEMSNYSVVYPSHRGMAAETRGTPWQKSHLKEY